MPTRNVFTDPDVEPDQQAADIIGGVIASEIAEEHPGAGREQVRGQDILGEAPADTISESLACGDRPGHELGQYPLRFQEIEHLARHHRLEIGHSSIRNDDPFIVGSGVAYQ